MSIADVAPREGAWIEITGRRTGLSVPLVAPREGAWIEISIPSIEPYNPTSRPVRARGLKFDLRQLDFCEHGVAPREGAWIEISRSRRELRLS